MQQVAHTERRGWRTSPRSGWIGFVAVLAVLNAIPQVAAITDQQSVTAGNPVAPAKAAEASEQQANLSGHVVGQAPASQAAPTAPIPPARPSEADEASLQKATEDTWGVKILAIRITAAGRALDFRYQVLDPDKARPLFDQKVKPVLTHEATGRQSSVPSSPKIGPLRNTAKSSIQKGKNYFILFGNPGGLVKSGDAVTVTVGDFRIEHLVVK